MSMLLWGPCPITRSDLWDVSGSHFAALTKAGTNLLTYPDWQIFDLIMGGPHWGPCPIHYKPKYASLGIRDGAEAPKKRTSVCSGALGPLPHTITYTQRSNRFVSAFDAKQVYGVTNRRFVYPTPISGLLKTLFNLFGWRITKRYFLTQPHFC